MTARQHSSFEWQQDSRGVMTATLDVLDSPVNVFNADVLADLAGLIALVSQRSDINALVFRSGKESGFLAGADVRQIQTLRTADEAQHASLMGQTLFNQLADLSIPTVAVIQGPCLGGGLEFALACKVRLVVNDSRTKLGLPEVELGLLPGWGGTQRLPQQIGLTQALPMILTGKKLSAKQAVDTGLADRLVEPADVDAALQTLLTDLLDGWRPAARPRTWKTWFLDHTRLGQQLVLREARRKIGSKSKHYPALTAILNSLAKGLNHRGKAGFFQERKSFGELAVSTTSRHLVGLFFQREKARTAATWAAVGCERPASFTKVGVIGGGVMGAGIAHWCATHGFDVALKEVTPPRLKQGLGRIQELFDDAVKKGVMTAQEAKFRSESIHGSTDWSGFGDADLVIEAATEKLDVKQAIFRELVKHVPWQATLATNTSALSISQIAEVIPESERVIGLHFFNPVHRMQLVEIVSTGATADSRIARLVEFVKKLGKTPVVCNDSPGFVVNRILFPYLDEAVRLVCEGVPADRVDRAIEDFGMPMGPLEMLDQVGLDVASHVADSLMHLSPEPSPTPVRLHEMTDRGLMGRKSGGGFFEYRRGKKKRITPTQAHALPVPELSDEMITERLFLRLVNEAARVLEEGIVSEPWMVDLALVLGTGFAPHTGGPLAYAEHLGRSELLHRLEQWTHTAGHRFTPAHWWTNHMVGSTN